MRKFGTARPSGWAIGSNVLGKVCFSSRTLTERTTHKPQSTPYILGGWDPETSKIHADLSDEIDQAFANVDMNLKHAGGKGWSQVYRINMYLLDLHNEEGLVAVVRNMKKWMPDHQPIMTCVGVKELFETMRIEIEVVAHDEEGAKLALAAAGSAS